MLEFETELIFTGKENRTSKNGKDYTLVRYLDDTGETFSTMATSSIPELKQLDLVRVKFGVNTGRYLSLNTLKIEKV